MVKVDWFKNEKDKLILAGVLIIAVLAIFHPDVLIGLGVIAFIFFYKLEKDKEKKKDKQKEG